LKRGQTYRCSICGSETLVIKPGKGNLKPVCCNQPQVLLKRLTKMYRCPVCGSEVALLVRKSESIKLVCCNTPMRAAVAKAA